MVGGTALEEMNTSAEDTVSLIRHDGEQSEPISSGYNLHRKRNRGREVRMIIVACLVFGIAVTAALIVDIYTGHHHTGHAAVVSDVKECADVGLDLIKKGGSATDAAIGAMLCVGVMNPESSGLGGGGFMLTVVPKKDKEKAEVIDFREVAPQAATKDMFKGNGSLARWGGLSVAVPGEIKGFELAHKKSGKLKWSEVFEPAIKLAKEGFKVTAHTGRVLRNLPKESLSTKLKEMILDPQGKPLKEGDIMRNPALAETLQNIADHGADVLYRGPIAEKIVAAVTSANGILTSKDLSDYKPLSKAVINSTYLGYQVITTPLPSGGPVLVSLLNILEGFNFTNKDQGKSRSYHYIIEAIKFAFAQRSLLEDGNVTKIVNQMLSKEHAKSLREKISPNKTFNESYYGPMFGQAESHGTAHVSVIGPDGELVSVTSSINEYFGSGIMTENGIILNNEMADFSIPGVTKVGWDGPPKANFIVPGRRPLSSCVPTVVLHKEKRCWFRMSLGASGGMYITPSVAEVLVSYLAFNEPLKNSIERPRVFFNINTGTPEIEADKFENKKVASSIRKDLRNMGHDISQRPALTDVNGLSYFKENVSAHADSRRGGEGSAHF